MSLVLAGCSIAIPIPSLYSDNDVTGSTEKPVILSERLDAADRQQAAIAMATALDGKRDHRVAWENASSGARGSFTPVASPFRAATGGLCRAFLAEIAPADAAAQSMQGSACKGADGKWTIRDVRPGTGG